MCFVHEKGEWHRVHVLSCGCIFHYWNQKLVLELRASGPVTFPSGPSACLPKCRARKGFAPGSSSTKGLINLAWGTVSSLCGSTEGSSICSLEMPSKSQEVHKNTKITMCVKKTAPLTGSSAFLLCVESGCIWLSQGHC